MSRGKKHTAEQIVNLLRQVEVGVANGKTLPQACKEAEIVEQTYFRWRKEYGGLKVDQARRLKELEQENAKLKRLACRVVKQPRGTQRYRPMQRDDEDTPQAIVTLASQYGRYGYRQDHGTAPAGWLACWQGPGGADLAS